MKTVDEKGFIANLNAGDIGLICSSNLFAKFQNLYRKKEKEGPLQASHGFYLREPPRITEANGLFVKDDAMIYKNVGDKTKCWVFRHRNATGEQIEDMNIYVDGMVDAGGHYSIGGIIQFGLNFLGIRKKISDESGVFCTELTGRAIMIAGLPYICALPPYAVTPSYQLNWFFDTGASLGWVLIGSYDGNGKFEIATEEEFNGRSTSK